MSKKMDPPKAAQGTIPGAKSSGSNRVSQLTNNTPDLCSFGNKLKFEQIVQNLKKSSFTKQLVLGATSGWITGVVTVKIGKFATCAVGSGILLYQIAQHQGLIAIDWNEVRQRTEKKKLDLTNRYSKESPKTLAKLRTFTKGNRVFSAAFLGGFLIGLGC